MASTSQQSKGSDDVLRKLDMAIQLLTAAKDAGGFAPAQIALGAACALLNMIRVRSLLLLDEQLPIHVHSGHDQQQTRVCRSWAVLRSCV
jgi:hypothetical protein